MNVVICSAFRNSTGYLATYIFQIRRLASALAERGDSLYVVWGEGDSTDNTRYYLEFINHTTHREPAGELRGILLDVSHHGPVFGSVVDAQRFKQLAYVSNKILANVPADADVVAYIESDLIWQPHTILALIDRLQDVPCVAPMVMHQLGCSLYGDPNVSYFYDTYAYRRNGVRFTNRPPYHPDINGEMLQLDSAGSCLVMNAAIARHVRFPEEDVVVGLCRQIYEFGASVWLDSSLTIFHS